jgi:hypothetical protein
MNRDALRADYAARLHADAVRRFGAARADALRPLLEDAAGWMAEVMTYPVDPDEPPAFYAEPAP